MKLREVRAVAGKELRETLRDRRTLMVMILFPLVVYPLVSLLIAQVMASRVARGEGEKAPCKAGRCAWATSSHNRDETRRQDRIRAMRDRACPAVRPVECPQCGVA